MNRRGFTLIELLVTIVIGAIAFFGLAIPFVAERSFSLSGTRQTEAQRDAQMGMRAIALVARGSKAVVAGGDQVVFTLLSGDGVVFQGGPRFTNQLQRIDTTHGTSILIDGVRSRVIGMVVTAIVANKLVRVRLEVSHEGTEDELLETEFFLRNGS